MRLLFTAITVFAVFGFVSIIGARSSAAEEPDQTDDSPHSIERWYYEQMMERYDNPRTAVRQRAEFRAAQRQARIAAMKWYGFSNSRPYAPAQPFTSHAYSPRWEGSWHRPNSWYTTGRPTVVVRPGYHVYR